MLEVTIQPNVSQLLHWIFRALNIKRNEKYIYFSVGYFRFELTVLVTPKEEEREGGVEDNRHISLNEDWSSQSHVTLTLRFGFEEIGIGLTFFIHMAKINQNYDQ